eukprot:XP_002522464.2 uncharacterized endoplasmic reticulum membrane protein C16E8.02 [Ricinus communis]
MTDQSMKISPYYYSLKIYHNTFFFFFTKPDKTHYSFPRKAINFLPNSLSFFRFSLKSIMGKSGFFDLEKHFAFYGAYHSNPVNVLIHMIFVWPIFFTALLILYFTPSVFNLKMSLLCHGDIVLLFNFGFLFALIYALFYIFLDAKAGSLAALLCAFCWVASCSLARWLGFSLAWKVVLVAQIVCWTGQFIGHGVFEKRAPALLDNLAQAFIMAPFFVLLEALQIFFVYEPYPGFHANVQVKIEAEINQWQEKKEKLLA